MGRPRKRRKQEVSLFPFLDILACVIGNLILIITAVVLEQVDTKPVAEAARIDDLEAEAERQQAKAAELQKQLDQLLERSGVATDRLAEVRAKIAAAKQKLMEAQKRVEAAAKPVPPPPQITADLTKLEEERKKLEAELKELERQVAERKKPPEQMIAILPPGSGGGPRRGVFVEAAKGKAIVHDPKPWEAPAGKVAADPRFKALLEKIRGDKDAIITFLIRPDGVGTYFEMQKAADAAGVRSGRVPLPGSGTLDLSEAR